MANIQAVTGNTAAALGAALSRADIIAAYPITPQSSVVEYLAELETNGEIESKMIHVESEHSAMSVVSGASLAGARTFTATSAQGLALMYEPYFRASSLRLPIIMPIVCREMTSPSSIWCGQQDAVNLRDAGWMQLFVENNQEILDMVIQGYLLAEDPDVLLPLNICYDGFYLSHLMERVEIPEQEKVDRFLPKYNPQHVIYDPAYPIAIDTLTSGENMMRYRASHMEGMYNALAKLEEVDKQFSQIFGRSHGGAIDCYKMEDAEVAVVTIGSMTGTAREAVDRARAAGVKAGLVKVRFLRPFPAQALAKALDGVKAWACIDRSVSFGWNCGPVYVETKAAMGPALAGSSYFSVIGGLSGADITLAHIARCIELLDGAKGKTGEQPTVWLNEDFDKEGKQ